MFKIIKVGKEIELIKKFLFVCYSKC